VRAARERLRLWDLTDQQIEEMGRRGTPLEYIPILSPASGYVVEKNVVEGAAVTPGAMLFRIAGLDRVWIEAEVYESDLALVQNGLPVSVSLPYLPDRSFEGHVAFVYPFLHDRSRTGRVRIELENRDLELKPDMYANVELQVDLGERLTIPEGAVIYAGTRHVVFVDEGEGRLRPVEIQVGVRSENDYEVTGGLEEGDVVVTSGNFLIAAESRLKTAMELW
jgi:Cu(I)/Ag(I) efflux system membrane fusion protein